MKKFETIQQNLFMGLIHIFYWQRKLISSQDIELEALSIPISTPSQSSSTLTREHEEVDLKIKNKPRSSKNEN